MRLTSGDTRHVILIGDKAIKIARTGVVRLIVCVLKACFDRSWVTEKIAERKGSAIRVFLHHGVHQVLAGYRANRQEYAIYRNHPELPIAPVLGLHAFGLVLVMARGEPVSKRTSASFRKRFESWGDLGEPKHICRVGTRLCLIDYGHPIAPAAFGI